MKNGSHLKYLRTLCLERFIIYETNHNEEKLVKITKFWYVKVFFIQATHNNKMAASQGILIYY